MAFNKNWKQFIVSEGEPFQIEHTSRAFGNRSRVVFKVDGDTGVVTVNGARLAGSQNFTGDLDITGDFGGANATLTAAVTAADLIATDDLTVGDDAAIGGDLAVTGASAFTGAVTLPADTVTGANLADALAAQIPMTATFSVGALVGDGRTVTVQLKDAGGSDMASVCRVSAWLSDTAKGTPIGQVTTGLTTTVPAGTVALIKLANMDYDILSTALGAFQVLVTDTNGTQTRYLNVSVNGVVYASAAIVTT